jgi:uncharacterized protein (TIGR03000 family)
MTSPFVRRPIARSWPIVFVLLTGVPVVSSDDPKSDVTPIEVTIHLPDDAELEIRGKKVDGSGELRHETVTPIKRDGESLYVFKASWKEGDLVRAMKRSLRLKPGDTAELDLNLDLNADEKMILSLINKEREKASLQPLTTDPKLNRAARTHSLNMAKQKKMSHELDGKGPADRLKDGGYPFRTFGENCAMGALTPPSALQMWMNSEAHKANILTSEFTETGIGIAGAQKLKYYTQVFAVPGVPGGGKR